MRSRRLLDLGGRRIVVRFSRHRCATCRLTFVSPRAASLPRGRYAARVRGAALRLRRWGWTLRQIREFLARRWKLRVSLYTLGEWCAAERWKSPQLPDRG